LAANVAQLEIAALTGLAGLKVKYLIDKKKPATNNAMKVFLQSLLGQIAPKVD
jgi:hypothetical protein